MPPFPSLSLLLLALHSLALLHRPSHAQAADHLAHSVPGGPYRVQDDRGVGSALVRLDGHRSHTHYVNPNTGALGRLVSYDWRFRTQSVCNRVLCFTRFPLGDHLVTLIVRDNSGDVSRATARVIVIDGAQPRLRLLLYPDLAWVPNGISTGTPTLSLTRDRLNLFTNAAFPAAVRSSLFSIRVLGEISIPVRGRYRFRVTCFGAGCTLWVNKRYIIRGANSVLNGEPVMLSPGTFELHVVYRRFSSAEPNLRFALWWMPPGQSSYAVIPASAFTHRPGIIKPVVNTIQPTRIRGGRTLTVRGTSFVNVQSVNIGTSACTDVKIRNQFVLTCVVPTVSGSRPVTVTTKVAKSNPVTLEVTNGDGGDGDGDGDRDRPDGDIGYKQEVKFTKTFLKERGSDWKENQVTSIALGPDNKFYIGAMTGIVHVLTVDRNAQVRSSCESRGLGSDRAILGVAFNPAEDKVRLYASVSTIHWRTNNKFPFNTGWQNGEIAAFEKGSHFCFEKVDTVITGLPVSNYDHAVNGVSFDHQGRLLITVGSSTNAGVADGRLGGIEDSPLTGAMLIAPVIQSGFNGRIRYDRDDDPGRARKVGGTVNVLAAGLRNTFGHTTHSNGNTYSVNNGGNAEFGARSTGCNSQTSADNEPDSLTRVVRGGFYGYANRNRGRSDPKQCIHRAPTDNFAGMVRPMELLEPSTDGIVEFTANTFGAQLRGDLLLTKLAVFGSGKVYRIQLNGNGLEVTSKSDLIDHSGLSAAMTPTGGLYMPRVYQGRVAALLPEERNPGRVVVTSVNPFRGPRRGGVTITITGWNFEAPVTVRVGGKACANVRDLSGDGRTVKCTVPSGTGKVPVVVRSGSGSSISYGYEFMYMEV